MQKILYIITQGEMGGAQRYVLDLARGLDKNQYKILVALGEEKSALAERLKQSDIPVVTITHLVRKINPFYDLLAIFEIEKLIRKFQPNVIHLNSSKAGVLGSFAAGLAKNHNVVFTAHGFAFLEPHLFKSLYFWAEKFATLFRNKIIAVSEFDRKEAIRNRLCQPEKLITIHNGIDLSRTNIRQLTTYNLQLNAFTIGTIAHDYHTKDLATLRQAFAILKSEFPNLQLTIIGRGGTIGEIPDATAELSKFDIYVCSSIKEGFPYSILEAMRAGLPIVSTAVGGIPEAIADGVEGLLVPVRSPEALAAAVKKLIVNPKLAQELGLAAQKKVQEFSLDKMLAETEKVYESLISASHIPRGSRSQ